MMNADSRAGLGLAPILAALVLTLLGGPWLLAVLLYVPGWFLIIFAARRRATATAPDYASLARCAEQDGMPSSAALWRTLASLDERAEPEPEPTVTQAVDRAAQALDRKGRELGGKLRAAEEAVRTERRREPVYVGPAFPERDRDRRHRRWVLDSEREQFARARMLESLRPATTEEYGRWLAGWAARGGLVLRHDYPMARWSGGERGPGVWVATGDLHLEPLHGSSALGIILVPRGVRVTGTEPGHTDVVWTRSGRTLGFHGVPIYAAPAFADAPVGAGRR